MDTCCCSGQFQRIYSQSQICITLINWKVVYLRDVIQFTGYGTVYWFYNYSAQQQKERVVLEEEKHKIEVSYLKGQINEHFTYNTLSMFHAEASKYSEELADGIVTLSDLMRYSVSEKESLVLLTEELEQLQAYIGLNEWRFGLSSLLNLHIEGPINGYRLPRMSVITLLENAFKHGAIKKEPVTMSVVGQEHSVNIYIKNLKKEKDPIDSTGLGIDIHK